MASREKRPLAPSKTKQKANNDSSSLSVNDSSSSSTSNYNSRNPSNKTRKNIPTPRNQLARDIFEAVATGSQLPTKIEASLPRKRALQTALKRKQKAKKTLIKVKQKVPIKALKRIADAKKILNKKKKQTIKSTQQQVSAENSLDNNIEFEETKNKCKTAKKPKAPAKASEEIEAEGQDKSSPKLSKKVVESSPKSTKSGKVTTAATQKRQTESRERDIKVKRSLSKEPEEIKIKTEPIDNSYEVTIEEVIASSMLIEEPIEVEGEESASEGELKGKKKSQAIKRSLRNGKLRQALPKADSDTDQRKTSSMSEASVDVIAEAKPLSDVNDIASIKTEVNEDMAATNHVSDTGSEIETNNNGCQNAEEIGPTLRSKTKARNSDSSCESKSVDGDVKVEDTNKASLVKSESDTVKKEKALAKFSEIKSASASLNATKCRRSSLNIDMRRSSFYGNEKMADGSSKSQIDEMIDQIKQTIAKSIESKIYKPEGKGLILGKIEVPKIEEVVAPLSNQTTKPKLEQDVDEEKPNVSKNRELNTEIGSLTKKEIKTEDTENSVPKVADTAKEIEKLVMGDIEQTDSQPPKDKCEQSIDDDVAVPAKPLLNTTVKDVQQDDKLVIQSTSNENLDDSGKNATVKQTEEPKKSSPPCPTRKSTRTTAGKSSYFSDFKKSISEDLDKVSKESENEKVLETPEKSEENEPKDVENEVVEKASNNECNEDTDKNKTVPEIEVPAEVTKEVESSALETNIESEKMEAEITEPEKSEETLESLSRDVERLVEEDDNNDKIMDKSEDNTENDNSDVEMRLMIDEEAPESEENNETLETPSEINDNNDGCDQKGTTESPEDVQSVEAAVEFTNSVQENSETETVTPKSATIATEDKLKDVAKTKELEVSEEIEQQKETRRVLRARGDKGRKSDTSKLNSSITASTPQEKSELKVKNEDAATSEVPLVNEQDKDTETTTNSSSQVSINENTETTDAVPVIKTEIEEQPEPQIRTRRSREVKKQPPPPASKPKRGAKKQEPKKIDQQHHQHKEETMLDKEVAEINENDRSSVYLKADENRGVSASAANNTEQQKHETKNRSKSENDVGSTSLSSDTLKTESAALSTITETEECKGSTKDSDEASTSGESSSSVEKILETPEDRAKKEDILRQLGLESWEKVKERKAKKEQQYTGTLKTIIRIQKEKEGKKRSRSPLKMVLKQQGRMDGEESFDFYTIQKEFGTSGLGDSSSDEDNDDAPIKDRQSLVIPEKSSSFSIHPGRLCADNCCYCHGKFGSLDTPMHLAQMKSDERKRKILENEVHLTKDSCLCDACYRHVDRKANMSPTNLQLKPQRQNRQSIMGCMARNCSEAARHHVKRRWLIKIKPNLRNEVEINWESSQHNLMTFCGTHYTKIERFLTCTLCKRRLTRNYTYPLGLTASATEKFNQRLHQEGIPANVVVNRFVCRLCRYFTKLNLKNSDLKEGNKDFYKKYRKKLLYYYDIDVPESEEETDPKDPSAKNKDNTNKPTSNNNAKKSKCIPSDIKLPSKSPDDLDTHSTTTSEKSSPEPPKVETNEPETHTKEETTTSINTSDSRFLGIEGAIEKLKKRKNLDTSTTTISSRSLLNNESTTIKSGKDVVEILAMDKEVTLTRLPKRPRLTTSTPTTNSNDITPVVQRLGANPSISVRTLFPGEEEMNLHANVEFNNVREVTPQGWEKCATMIQYDRDTKLLWQELQRPYGNQSSFLRHLILLEKYYRAGDLILAPNASRNAINYSTSVQNRLISYEGPEKPDEPIMEPITTIEYNNSRRLSGGYVMERDNRLPSTSTSTSTSNFINVATQLSKLEPSSRVMKLTPGVSIIKKPPPNLQRLNMNNTGGVNGSAKRKESIPVQKNSNNITTGGKVFTLTEPAFKRLQTLKRQKQMMNERQTTSSPNNGLGSSSSPPNNYKAASIPLAQYQKAQQMAQQSQFQKHLRMQQEMYNQRSRGDFEPLICDIRLANENSPTQNLINTLNLPKSIQVTTKGPATLSLSSQTPIPILPKIPKSLTVIPQTVARAQDK